MENDIRWEQRFSNYIKAFNKLEQSVSFIQNGIDSNEYNDDEVLDEMIKEGLIQRFEYTHELAWNVMKDYIEYQGNNSITGSRDATREAFKLTLISNGELWMDMLSSRNKTSHTYNDETANEIYHKIIEEYYSAFLAFRIIMEEKRSESKQTFFNK